MSKKLIIFIAIFSFMLVACNNTQAKIKNLAAQAQALTKDKKYDEATSKYEEILKLKDDQTYRDELNKVKISKLQIDADLALSKANFDDAITLYNKMLDIKEDSEMRHKLDDIKYEKDSVDNVKKFNNNLYDILEKRIRSGISVSPTDMEYIIQDLRRMTEEFEKIDDSKGTDITEYIKSVKNDLSYTMFKITINSKLHDDAGLSEAIGKLDDQMNLANAITVAFTRNDLIDKIPKILAMKIPDKYDH